jgi:predicted transcriptional regulator
LEPTTMTAGSLASTFQLLSQPSVLTLLLAVRDRPLSRDELIASADVIEVTARTHLGLLRAAGLIESHGRKLGATYRITPKGEALARSLDPLLRP